jgi:SAM-dependent methyltransferase
MGPTQPSPTPAAPSPATHVDPTNLEQARAWDGDEGAYWAQHPQFFEASLRRYDAALLAAADLHPDHVVLDVGCGTGHTTRQVARQVPAGQVLGVDLSNAMIETARTRTAQAGLNNAAYAVADAQVHAFTPASFDRVVSRTGTMFFGDLAAAFANLARALRPSGRFVQLVWQPLPENEWIATFLDILAADRDLPAPPPGAPGPFTLSDPGRTRALLVGAGFEEPEITGLREPMWFGHDADEATARIGGLMAWMIADLDDDRRRATLADLHATMVTHEGSDGVELGSATWVVSAIRHT